MLVLASYVPTVQYSTCQNEIQPICIGNRHKKKKKKIVGPASKEGNTSAGRRAPCRLRLPTTLRPALAWRHMIPTSTVCRHPAHAGALHIHYMACTVRTVHAAGGVCARERERSPLLSERCCVWSCPGADWVASSPSVMSGCYRTLQQPRTCVPMEKQASPLPPTPCRRRPARPGQSPVWVVASQDGGREGVGG